MSKIAAAVALLLVATPGWAQERPFTGPSVGAEAGYLEHHFAVEYEESDSAGTVVSRRSEYLRSHGIGGGLFAGYDIASSDRWRLGVELGASAGGRTVALRQGGGALTLDPRFGVKATVRAGYVLTPRLMAYGLAGYGGNRYRVRDTIGVGGSDDSAWGSSFVVGAGAEYRIDRRIGLRLDGKHVDNQTWQLMVGVPIRF